MLKGEEFERENTNMSRTYIDDRKDTMAKSAQSIDHFCDDNEISKAHLYNLLKRGEGPVVMKVGRRTLISAESAAEWRRRMEALADARPAGRGRRDGAAT